MIEFLEHEMAQLDSAKKRVSDRLAAELKANRRAEAELLNDLLESIETSRWQINWWLTNQ